MKRLGRLLGNAFAVALTVFALHAAAETQMGGRDFNHMATGYPLSGGHAIAACESCHIGGVFKGTPRNCDGCHALGKRVVATPKSTSHVVTDAPCETCHFNTSTFLGARFNHGMAIPGQCATCHNGRTAEGKGSNAKHSGAFANYSCDSCHRTSTWMIAGWNHTGEQTAGRTCNDAACHSATGLASAKQWNSNPKHLPFPTIGGASFANCQTCHLSYSSFSVVHYSHPGGLACGDCHNTTYNLGSVRAMPGNHIPIGSTSCQSCHTSGSSWGGMNHNALGVLVCKTCHLSGTSYLGNMQRKSLTHESNNYSGTDCTGGGCHSATNFSRWN